MENITTLCLNGFLATMYLAGAVLMLAIVVVIVAATIRACKSDPRKESDHGKTHE